MTPVSGRRRRVLLVPSCQVPGQMGIAFRVGQSRLVIMDLVNSDAEAEQVKPVLLALAKAAAPKMK